MNFVKGPNLVLYLPLYALDGASIMSLDAGGCPCTVYGSLWTPQGRGFDGVDDYVGVGNPTALQMVNNITVDLWLSLSAPQSSAQYAVPVSHGHSATNGWVFQFDHTDPVNASWVHMSNNGVGLHSLRYQKNLFDQTWHHLAATKSPASGMRIYLDGEVHNGNGGFTSDMVLTGNDINIGRDSGTANVRCMTGLVGEVGIYNRALTPVEIQQYYLATKWRYV